MEINIYALEKMMNQNRIKHEQTIQPEKIKVENETSWLIKLKPKFMIG